MRAQAVAGEIQELIRREGIGPGGSLPSEHALARRFGVSRPLLREAIQSLKTLGVVDSRPRRGLRVLPFEPESHLDPMIRRIRTAEERADLYELRRLLEPGVLRLAGRRARPLELDALEAMLRVPFPRGREAVREGLERDVRFHEALWRIAGNRFVWALRGLLVRYFASLETGRLTEAMIRRANAEHLAIVRALRAGDVDRAARLLERNLGAFGSRP
jgi:GntR family transcriptional repressor for pyruvate dehydrogenase complex